MCVYGEVYRNPLISLLFRRRIKEVVGTSGWTSSILFLLFIFLLLNNKNQGIFLLKSFRLGACCLTILIHNFKSCLRVRCAHATPTFAELKVDVYGMKGGRLWDEKWLKVDVYGMSLRMPHEPNDY